MRKEEFRAWLQKGHNTRSTSDCISRCRKIEKSLSINLDEEFLRDEGKELISKLAYSMRDERENKPLPKGIQFKEGTHIYQGVCDLRSAANRYFNFCKHCKP